MTDNIILSIIIPAYNVAPYIEECLGSVSKAVKDSDVPQIELIIIEDCSNDGTLEIIENYTSPFRMVKIVNKKNEGLSKARNKGLDVACGKYIMFMDSDDYLVPDSLGKVLAFLRDNADVDMVQYGYYELWEENASLVDRTVMPAVASGCGQTLFAEWARRDLFDVMVWMRIVSRSVIADNELYFCPNLLWEDNEWMPRVFAYAKNVVCLPYRVYVYRRRKASISLSAEAFASKKYKHNAVICDSLAAFADKEGLSAEYRDELRCYASDLFWEMFKAVRVNGVYNEDAIKKINERRYLIQYSKNIKRRWIYRILLSLLGVKIFSLFRKQ